MDPLMTLGFLEYEYEPEADHTLGGNWSAPYPEEGWKEYGD